MHKPIRRLPLFIFALFLFASGCGGGISIHQLPKPSLSDITESRLATRHVTLDNGLEVLIIQRDVVPLVTILAAVKNGAMAESPEYDGLSHLYEHMFFKGNEELPNQEAYLKRMRELGMSFNGTTSTEAVQYFFTLPKENLKEGLEFMRAALISPLFEEGELQREIKTVLSEYDRNESEPPFHLRQAMTKALFSKHYSRKNVIGDRKIIETATREKMQTIQHRYYIPNNTLLVIAGNVTPERTEAIVRKLFKDWPRAENPYVKWPIPDYPPLEKNREIVLEHPYQNVLISFAWQGPSVGKDPKATYAADIFSYILGQRSSAFQKRLVESGLLHSASFSYYTQAHVGPVNFSGFASPEQAPKALEAMKSELERMLRPDYFSDEELANAKIQLAVRNLYQQQESLDIATEFGFWWCVAGLSYRLHYISNLKSVERADIAAFLDTYIKDKPHVLGMLIDPAARKRFFPATDEPAPATLSPEGKEVAK